MNLDGIYQALGIALNELNGNLSTKLISDLYPEGTVAFVESTYSFPDAGVIYVGGERATYSSKTDISFVGLQRRPFHRLRHPAGTAVADGSMTYSALHQARADRLIRRAQGLALDDLAWEHGERRPLADDEAFQRSLRVLTYLDRGPWWALYRVLEALLYGWARSGTAQVQEGAPNVLVGAPGEFLERDVGCPVTIAKHLCAVRSVSADGSTAALYRHRGRWWSPAAFVAGPQEYVVQPFRIQESPALSTGRVHLVMYVDLGLLPPSSYVLDGEPAELAPPGWPEGMEVLEDADASDDGFEAWYLVGFAEDGALMSMLQEVVPAHVGVDLLPVIIEE